MDPADPAKGFRYLYLTPEDYTSIAERAPAGAPAVRAESIAERGEQRWRLTGEHAGCPERGALWGCKSWLGMMRAAQMTHTT